MKLSPKARESLGKIYSHLNQETNSDNPVVQGLLEDIADLHINVDPEDEKTLDGRGARSFRCRIKAQENRPCGIHTLVDSILERAYPLSKPIAELDAQVQSSHKQIFQDGRENFERNKVRGNAGIVWEGVSLSPEAARNLKTIYSRVFASQEQQKNKVAQNLLENISSLFRDVDPSKDSNLEDKSVRSFRCRKQSRKNWQSCDIYQQMSAIRHRSSVL